jgi:hypothetical protein
VKSLLKKNVSEIEKWGLKERKKKFIPNRRDLINDNYDSIKRLNPKVLKLI